MRRSLLLLLIPLSFTSLTAQDTLTAGDKVRVTTEEERVVGYWVSLDHNQLTLNTEARDSSLVLPLASLTKLEVSRGQKSKTASGALIGGAVGLAAGGIVGAALCSGEPDCPEPRWLVGAAYVGGIGLVVGAGIGAIIGTITKVDRWETVALDQIRVSLTPREGGLEVSAKFVF